MKTHFLLPSFILPTLLAMGMTANAQSFTKVKHDPSGQFEMNSSNERKGGDSLGRQANPGPVQFDGITVNNERKGGDSLGRQANPGPVQFDGITINNERKGGDSLGRISDGFEVQLKAYPNPAVDRLQLNFFGNTYQQVSIQVVSTTGALVDQICPNAVVGENDLTLDVSSLPIGTYHVILHLDGETFTRRFVKM